MNDRMDNTWAAAVALVVVAKKARARLIQALGDKIELVQELDGVITLAEQAITDEQERCMKDAQLIRALAAQRRGS